MKTTSMKLESKVLLTALVLCLIGTLRMTHLIHFSERDDILLLFVVATELSGFCMSSDRFYAAACAAFSICIGLVFWTIATLLTSGPIAKGFALFLSGLSFVTFVTLSLLAVKHSRKTKKQESPAVHAAD